MVLIVDYGLGNLRSVAGAVARLGHAAVVSGRPEDVDRADRIILPGVGAFGDGMANLRQRGLVEPLTRAALRDRKPVLGICLGAQLMAARGTEFGAHQGLGWLDAEVVRLDPPDKSVRVPHVGWNEARPVREGTLLRGIPAGALFYYVHSYHLRPARRDVVVAESDHGEPFVAAFEDGTIAGTQFHPEKSQRHGLAVLRNFLEAS